MFCIRKVPTMQPPGHFLKKKKKKISNGRRALWPKALLENQKMWVANYFKYPQQVKLDVEKYVLNIYFCLWWNWNQMTPNNILCERVINQLQMEPNCWSFTFAALIISIQLKEKVSWGVIWDGPSHQSLQMHPQHYRLHPAKDYLECRALGSDIGPVQDISPAPGAGHLTGAVLVEERFGYFSHGFLLHIGSPIWFPCLTSTTKTLSSSLHRKCYPSPVWFLVAVKVTGKISKRP